MKLDDQTFWRVAGGAISFISLAAISAYKITLHGKDIKHIQEKIEPLDSKHRLITAEEMEIQLNACGLAHREITGRIFDNIAQINETIKAGEDRRNEAREERSHHLEQLTIAITSLEAKLK